MPVYDIIAIVLLTIFAILYLIGCLIPPILTRKYKIGIQIYPERALQISKNYFQTKAKFTFIIWPAMLCYVIALILLFIPMFQTNGGCAAVAIIVTFETTLILFAMAGKITSTQFLNQKGKGFK